MTVIGTGVGAEPDAHCSRRRRWRAVRPGAPGDDLPAPRSRGPACAWTGDQLAAYDRVCGFRLSDELPVDVPAPAGVRLQVALMTERRVPVPDDRPGARGQPDHARPGRCAPTSRSWCGCTPNDLRPHERGTQFDMVSEAQRGRRVRCGRRSAPTCGATAGLDVRGPTGEVEPAARPAARWRVPGDTGRRYADGVRRPQPDPPASADRAAVRLPAGDRARHVVAWRRCLAFYEGRLPAAYTVDVRFKLPILLPATVALYRGRRAGFDAAATGGRASRTCPACSRP